MNKKIPFGQLKNIAFYIVIDALLKLENKEITKAFNDDNFTKFEPMDLEKKDNYFQKLSDLYSKNHNLVSDFPHLQPFGDKLRRLLNLIQSASKTQELLNCLYQMMKIFNEIGLEKFKEKEGCVIINTKKGEVEINFNVDEENPNSDFIGYIMKLNENLRSTKSNPTKDEYLAISIGSFLVKQGATINYPSKKWGTSGFRQIQTLMSITDPGLGHIHGTSTKSEYLHGIICHIEHLERANTDRHLIESYRIPSIKDVALVRFRIGSSAPISSYIGRPLFENGFYHGLLKTVNTIASAVSHMFSLGLCECKIAIEGMTANESICFMQCIAGAVKRDEHRQILSAAFNINTPILDNRQHNHWVKDRFQIALLGIELTVAGGFDKVTWDGSAETYPSKCILEQLSHAEAVELVHKAHEKGLLTYFSAGFRYNHLPLAVYTGVDGVGVGGAQILRYMDKKTGYHGPFKPENISEILKIRNEAMNNWQGKSAELLARLDRMYYENSLAVSDNEFRIELFEAIKANNQAKSEALLEHFSFIKQLPSDTENPLIEWAKRLIQTGEKSLIAQRKTRAEWASLVWNLQLAINNNDLDWLAELLKPQTPTAKIFYLYPNSEEKVA